MLGPHIIVRSLSENRIADRGGTEWQYHPQSDRHSKIACWAVLFDLVRTCPLLLQHIRDQRVGFGINHSMIDFTADRKKDLDLVVAIPRSGQEDLRGARSFRHLAEQYHIRLSADERRQLEELPDFMQMPVGDVLLALEAKASMAAHVRAGPRLYDELTSAWQCINGSSAHAIAVAFGMVNASSEFVSPKRNAHGGDLPGAVVSVENQPNGALHIQRRFRSLRVRGHVTERGYDAVGLITVIARNDGSPIELAPVPPGLPNTDSLHYERMVLRIAGLYDGRFSNR